MNRSPHLSDDELIGLLYGVGDAEEHLAVCAECGERWAQMHRALGRTRAESAGAAEVSGRTLAVQRQEILEGVERLSRTHAWQWVPAAAVASLLAAALVVYRPSGIPKPAPAASAVVNAESDGELFTDVYSMEQEVEPRAAAPIRALFISEVKGEEASFEPAAPAEESQKQ